MRAGILRREIEGHSTLEEWVAPALGSHQFPPWFWLMPAGAGPGFLFVYHQLTAEIGFWLAPELRGQGHAEAALTETLAAFQVDKNPMLMATVEAGNPAAARVCEKAGFRVLAAQDDRTVYVRYWRRSAA